MNLNWWISDRIAERHLRRWWPVGQDVPDCRCRCYGCRHHCGAHWTWWRRTSQFWKHPIENYRWNRARRNR